MRFRGDHDWQAVTLMARAVCAIAMACGQVRRAVRGIAYVGRFGSRGTNFWFDPDGIYSYATIHVGNNVNLGLRPIIVATRSSVRIGDNVMFGPEVTIRGGNHRMDVVGTPMIDCQKESGDNSFDKGVVIEDDVWVGTRAVILHGVTIGRGAVVGAGAVVTRSVPPYSVAVGNPARVVGRRWPPEVIAEHERRLYSPRDRLTGDDLCPSSGQDLGEPLSAAIDHTSM